ncbi:MAG TPA: SDR family oxidoreductase [Solirubrobacterales bacterium]|jgi:NAD(P)-dependent dehydrogenase (short-subunit alcohol dehydrogenase family)|nr:SDR family oxidoreductase [Solirubrobacterales bacterium]
MKIEGATALVTGANRGIGKQFAEELLARGAAKVYAGVRDPATITDPRLVAVALDVTDDARLREVAAELTDVDLVVNNAGAGHFNFALEADLDNARKEIEVNYLGIVSMTKAFAPVLAENGGGAIVNMLSVLSWFAAPVLSTYSASKAAAWLYSNASRVELKGQGTEVLGVHAGYVDTDLIAEVEAEKLDPRVVAVSAFDALEAGESEVAVDERSRQVKAGLSEDQRLIYPGIEEQFAAAAA